MSISLAGTVWTWSQTFVLFILCSGWSDREDLLELNDRDVTDLPRGVKSILDDAAGKAPPPAAGPHVRPAVEPDAAAGAVVEPKGPNVPILPKPPIKVRAVFVFINCTAVIIYLPCITKGTFFR